MTITIEVIRAHRERLNMSTHPPERIEYPVAYIDAMLAEIDKLQAEVEGAHGRSDQ